MITNRLRKIFFFLRPRFSWPKARQALPVGPYVEIVKKRFIISVDFCEPGIILPIAFSSLVYNNLLSCRVIFQPYHYSYALANTSTFDTYCGACDVIRYIYRFRFIAIWYILIHYSFFMKLQKYSWKNSLLCSKCKV